MNGDLSILALVEAGRIKEDDDTLGIIQGISLENARAVADWLCIATGAPVKLRYMSLLHGVEHIERTPESLKIQALTVKTPGSAT